MLLTAQQILAAQDKKTTTVPVPEWGEGAEVLVGSMGALARAQMDDYFKTMGQSPEPDEDDEMVTCDAPAEVESREVSPGARAQQLEGLLRELLSLDAPSADDWLALQKHITSVLDGTAPPPKVYSSTENSQIIVRWCAECILDPKTYRPAFSLEQVAELGGKHPAALERIYNAALELTLSTNKARDEFEKNSERTPADSSGGA